MVWVEQPNDADTRYRNMQSVVYCLQGWDLGMWRVGRNGRSIVSVLRFVWFLYFDIESRGQVHFDHILFDMYMLLAGKYWGNGCELYLRKSWGNGCELNSCDILPMSVQGKFGTCIMTCCGCSGRATIC